MITLFRRLRQKLIASGSVTKYLLYAIGEILLLVIGILIALQVNNWNEVRKEYEEERETVERLRAEFVNNLDELRIDIERVQRSLDASRIFLEAEKSAFTMQIDSAEFYNALSDAVNSPTWSPSSYSLSDLKNSGKITKLRNEELVSLLFEWDKFNENLLETTENYVFIVERLRSYVIESGIVRNLNIARGFEANLIEEDLNILLKDNERFFNHNHGRILGLGVMLRHYKEAEERLLEIIAEAEN